MTPTDAKSHWPRRRAKFLFERERREPREQDGIVTAFRDGEVTLRIHRRVDGFTNAVQEIGYQGIRKGDLVIHSMDGFAGAIGVSDSDGKASPVVHAYVPRDDVDARFYAYLLRHLARSGFIASLARGIRERSTAFDSETFLSLPLPKPPLTVQRAIADLLDAETARIDALVAKKRRMIELLVERRRAVFDELAVPQMLGGTADRNAGERWTATALKRCAVVFTDGDWVETPYITDDGIRLIQTGNVGEGEYRDRGFRFVSEETFRDLNCTEVFPGDVLISRLAGPVGRACIAQSSVVE